jgi:hypothetical protein
MATGSSPTITIGISEVAALAASPDIIAREDHGNAPSDHICHELRQTLKVAFGQVLDCHVLALDQPHFLEAAPERVVKRFYFGKPGAEISNHGNCRNVLSCPAPRPLFLSTQAVREFWIEC